MFGRLLFALICCLAACSGGGTTVGAPGGPVRSNSGGSTPSGTSSSAPSASESATPTPGPHATAGPTATPSSTNTPAPVSSTVPNVTPTVPFSPSPDSDAFYAQPNPFPSDAPGTILASRSVTYAPQGGVAMPNTAYELKFVSRDTNGHPIAAVAVVALPTTPALGTQPLLVDGLAEDGLGAQCAPSHDVTGSTADGNEQLEATLALEGLTYGWVVIYPDYEGPESAYGSGPLAGYIALDSIRAAEHFAADGLNASTPVGIYGYSGGAFLSGWAATLEKSYAPELNIVGIASGGTPASPAGIVQNIDTNTVSNAAFFNLILSAIEGVNRSYPTIATPVLNAKGVAAFTSLENGCIGATSNGAATPTGTVPDYTTVADPLSAPGAAAVLPLITLAQPGEPPVANVFVFHSQVDELIPIAGPDAMVQAWCSAGSTVEYYRGVTGDHIAFEVTAGPLAFAYLLSRFEGQTITPPTTTTCN